MILLTAIPAPFAAFLVIVGLFLIGIPLWIFGGWLADRYDAWRTDNWKGWRG